MNEPQPPNNRIPPESKPEKRKSIWHDEPQPISAVELNAHIIAVKAAVKMKPYSLVYIGDDGLAYPCNPEDEIKD